jgi:hypothetical protein
MTQKTAKPKKAKKPKDPDQPSVLANLPATRPSRIGGTDRSDAPKPRARAQPSATRPKRAAEPQAARPKPAAGAPPAGSAAPGPARPRPVRAGAPTLEPGRERPPTSGPGSGPPSGTELVTTAIQAAGELAQIGLTVGGQILKRAVDRLPKP